MAEIPPRFLIPGAGFMEAGMIEVDLGSLRSGEDIFSALLSRIVGLSREPVADFGSAHYDFDLVRHLPNEFVEGLARAVDARNEGQFCRKLDLPRIRGAVERILGEETSLDLSRYRIHPSCKSTRSTLRTVFDSLTNGTQKSVALPVPNWHFWCMYEDKHETTPFRYFNALNPKELVEGFDQVSRSGDVGALVLLSPANPPLYELSRDDVSEIDRIAAQRGVKVIIDEVMRGTRPIGQRDSIASWFQNPPFVVEGFGKRFGEGPLANISYVLVPRGERITKPKVCKRCDIAGGALLNVAFDSATQPAIQELDARNAAFDRGLLSTAPTGVTIQRPYSSFLVSLVNLPERFPITPRDFAFEALDRGASVSPLDVFYPENYNIPNSFPGRLRITTGHIGSDRMENGAAYLGAGIKSHSK